ncbi:MAG: 3-dehydro-L-gulonate 2-dehydrogenase [Melioribacteraceae bacterium]|nr:3-dehydro-L-gulonate 2-dehydrogenase [Melioribacteraceae bacterium]MCF8266049.1 3-dehydro-L-gulonate 2-dehydrogenase [Melioribacteraceae bacterium]MCF8431160.1 3-dehydro-L-gulonate 2-dehydrogenase [Melioribacteraceae bacterium]
MANLNYGEIKTLLEKILIKYGFSKTDADLTSEIFTDNTFSGVASHGVNRFAAFIKLAKEGFIVPDAKPKLIKSFGAWEQWDGQLGPGPLNSLLITDRVMKLAKENGIGCVALRNTNHWMRAGTYGWKAAENGFILICWTNTIPILPPWGAKESTTGNNPFVLAVPRKNGHVVLDMALSLFSYGKLSSYRREGNQLPFIGGYDSDGNLTTDAGKIYDAKRPLPIGYWKGSGLSLLFDLIATIMSGGKSTMELGQSETDSGMSQIYIALDPSKSMSAESIDKIADEIINYYKSAEPETGEQILYPGERVKLNREKYKREGFEIDDNIYSKITDLL